MSPRLVDALELRLARQRRLDRLQRVHESRYSRFRDSLRELSPRMVSHFTQIDYDLHLALIAVRTRTFRSRIAERGSPCCLNW